ncbi:MAG: tetratricopeptide repeat protein, partial [Planctomycetota bacterium]
MRVALFVALVVGLCGCAQFQGAPPETPAWDPDARAQELRAQWVGAPDYPTCSVRGPTGLPAKARTRIRKDAEALVFCHPRHVEARMLAAILAYEERDPVRATQHLDDVLVLNPTHPEAAVLRSRIAVEAGNAPYAISLLESQIQLSPDHAGLREALASAYFLAGRHDEARAALDAADSLGAPQWRV